jgi:hypothetical protein
MPILTGGNVIDGTEPVAISGSGAPAAGTAEVQTLTIGGTPTGGTFKLRHGGFVTAAITWSATNGTLVANIDAALEALPSIGASGVVVGVGTLSSGIGDASITFANKREETTLAVAANNLTGSSPTLAIAKTTPGVNPSGAGAGGSVPKGGTYMDLSTGISYANTGTALAPTWTKIGTQT